MSHHRPRGFTLIELAIVLVIIGLIVGGVLVGRDLIRAAEIRATIKQLEDFNSAANAFRTKYNCLPGDCPDAVAFGFAPNSNGTGDHVIGVATSSACPSAPPESYCQTKEHVNFWYHLATASLISFATQDFYSYCPFPCGGAGLAIALTAGYTSPPVKIKSAAQHPRPPAAAIPLQVPFTGGWVVLGRVSFNANVGGDTFQEHSFALASPWTDGILGGLYGDIFIGYSPSDIYSIDMKIDDGLPFSGQARAVSRRPGGTGPADLNNNLRSSPGRPPTVPATAYCADDTAAPPQYNAGYGGNTVGSYPMAWRAAGNCSLVIKATF